ncbi:MAG: hypothetical protein ACREWE_05405 [Gammaproteobacteria bacterium]
MTHRVVLGSQKRVVAFHEFFALLLPALVNWLIPAWLLSRTVPADGTPPPGHDTGLHDTGHQNAERRVSGIGRAGSHSASRSRSRAIIRCTCHGSSG